MIENASKLDAFLFFADIYIKTIGVISISGNEIQQMSGTTFIEKVVAFFVQQGSIAKSPFGNVVLDKRGAKNSKNHGIGIEKAKAFAAVKDVLEQGSIQVPMGQYNTNPNKKLLTGMIVANIQISGNAYTCVVEVCRNAEGLNRLYNHEVTPLETQKPQDVVATSRVSGGDAAPRQHQGEMAKVAKDFQSNNNETNESKNMKKNTMKLNESQLRKIVAESLKKVFNESVAEGRIRETDFQQIASPCRAFKRTSKETAEKLSNNGFSYMQDYRKQAHCNLTHGFGYYFMKQDLGSSYGDTLVSVEIQPGARIKFEEQNDIIIVHPEDGDKIKIMDIKTTYPGQITEQKLRKMIVETIKKVLNEKRKWRVDRECLYGKEERRTLEFWYNQVAEHKNEFNEFCEKYDEKYDENGPRDYAELFINEMENEDCEEFYLTVAVYKHIWSLEQLARDWIEFINIRQEYGDDPNGYGYNDQYFVDMDYNFSNPNGYSHRW